MKPADIIFWKKLREQPHGMGLEAVSEAIGTILMLAVATMLVGVVALYVGTLPPPDDPSHVDLTSELVYDSAASTDTISIRHTGGETLFNKEITIRVKVNYADIAGSPFYFSDCDTSTGTWNGDDYWEVGETWSKTVPAVSNTGDVTIMVIEEKDSKSDIIMKSVISQTMGGHAMPDLAVSGIWVEDWNSDGHILDERETININVSNFGDAGTAVPFSDISINMFDGDIYMGSATMLVGVDISGNNDNILDPAETAQAELNLSLNPWKGWLYTGRHTLNVKIIPLDEEKGYSNNYLSILVDVLDAPPDFRFNGPDPSIGASGVRVSNENPQNGETIQVFVTVRNVGDADITFAMDVLLVVSTLPINRILGTEFYQWYDDNGSLGSRNGAVDDESFDPSTCKISGISIPSSGEITYTFPMTVKSSKPGESLVIYAAVDAFNNASHAQSVSYTDGDNEKDNKAQKTIQVMPTVLLVDDDGKDPGQVGDTSALVRESLIGAGISPKDYYTTAKVGALDTPTYSTSTTPPAPMMQDYDIIIWVIGRDDSSTVLTNSNINELKLAMNNGKFVWIIGNGLCEGIYAISDGGFTNVATSSNAGSFLRTYLGIRSYRTNYVPTGDFEVMDPVTYNPAGQYIDGWKNGESNYMLDYQGSQTMERIQPVRWFADRQVGMVVNGSAGVADITMDNTIAYNHLNNGLKNPYKSIYSGFDLDSVPRLNDRVKLIYTVMNWFNWTMKVGNDVAVTKMDLSPSAPKYMDNVNISVVVRNNGPFAVNSQVMFYVTSPNNPEQVIPTWGGDDNPVQLTLNPGEERVVSKNWLAITTGLHTFRAMIDPYNLLQETLESNNDLSYSTSEITSSKVSQNILFVDDDGGDTGSTQLVRAIGGLEYNCDVITVGAAVDGPDVDTLKHYNTVIWYCGDATVNTIRTNDKISINNYLSGNYLEASLLGDHNETIWLIGEGIANSLANGVVSDTFFRDIMGLGTKIGGAGSSSSNILGFQNNPISHGMNYPRVAGGGNRDDLFTPQVFGGVVDNAFGVTSPDGGTHFNSIAHQNNDTYYKTFFSGWDPANIAVAGSDFDVKINEVTTGSPDGVEIVNTGMSTIDLTGWSIRMYDGSGGDLFHFPGGFTIGPGSTVFIDESDPGVNTASHLYDSLHELNIGWTSASQYYVNLLNNEGTSVDYMTRASSGGSSYPNPGGVQWSGPAIAYASASSYTRRSDLVDTNTRSGWIHGNPGSLMSLNPGQDLAAVDIIETGIAENIYLSLHWLGLHESRPDFRCTDMDIRISDETPQLGNSYVISARVANVGGQAGSCSVRFLDGNTLLKTETPYLEADTTVNLECIWVPLYAGDAGNMRMIKVQLDPLDLVDEVFDTYNNYPQNPTKVYFFYDDMEYETTEEANSAWGHESTVIKINGESTLEYLDNAETNIVSDFNTDTLNNTAWIHNYAVDHSMNSSFSVKEPLATGGINTQLDIMLVLDRSGSMSLSGRWTNLVIACDSLIDSLDANDRVAIFTFDSYTNAQHQFVFCDSAGKTTLKNFIGAMGTPGGGTNLYSAIIEDKGTSQVWNGDFDGEGGGDDDDGALWYLRENYRAAAIPNLICMSDGASAYGDYANARNAIWTAAGYGGSTNYIDQWRGNHATYPGFSDIGLYSYSIALGINHDPLCGSTNPIQVRPRSTYSNELMMWTIAQESMTGGDLNMGANGVYDPGEYAGYGYYYTTDPTELSNIFTQISQSMGSGGSARSAGPTTELDPGDIAVSNNDRGTPLLGELPPEGGFSVADLPEEISTLSRAELDTRGYTHGVNADYYDYNPTVRRTYSFWYYDARSTILSDSTPLQQNWGTAAPIAGIDTDYFGVRWSGYLYADYSQSYTFRVNSDDGAMVYVDGTNVIGVNNWRDQNDGNWRTGSISLAKGLHQILIINYQGTGDASLRVQWNQGGSYADVPLSNLYIFDNALDDTILWSQDFNIVGGNTYSYPSWITNGYSSSYARWLNSLGLATQHDLSGSYLAYPYNRGGSEGHAIELRNNGIRGRMDWDLQDAFLEDIKVTMSFDWRAYSLESSDRYYLRVYDGSWKTLFTWDSGNDDNTWHNGEEVEIPASCLRYADLRFEVYESVSSTSDYLYLDNLEIEMDIASDPNGLSAPTFPTPQDTAENVNIHPTLMWYCGPSDMIDHYNIYLGTTTNPSVVEDPVSATVKPFDFKGEQFDAGQLQASTTYYWKVKVFGTDGSDYTSEEWTFTIETVNSEQAGGPPAVEGLNALETKRFTVSGATDVTLEFYQKYFLAGTINGAYLELGVYDGSGDREDSSNYDWYYIQPEEPYNSNLYLGTASAIQRPLLGPAASNYQISGETRVMWCWNGKSNNGMFDWEFVSVDLMKQATLINSHSNANIDLSAQPLKMRFSYFYFGGGKGGGWWIDDVKLVVSTAVPVAGSSDVWVWNKDTNAASGQGYWWNGNPSDHNFLLGGIDNSLISRPIDLTRAVDARFNAQLAYNVNPDVGMPPDGMRIEVSDDGGLTWTPINYGVRSFSGHTGGVGSLGYVDAQSLPRINFDVTAWAGKVILLRFRVVTTSESTYTHNDANLGWGGIYLDDVTIEGISISDVRSTPGERVGGMYGPETPAPLPSWGMEGEQIDTGALFALIGNMRSDDLGSLPAWDYTGARWYLPPGVGQFEPVEA